MALTDKLEFILPKKKTKTAGSSATPGYAANNAVRAAPTYSDHRNDLFDTRLADDSRTLLNNLTRHDPDVSSAIFAFGTISSSAQMIIRAMDPDGQIDRDGIKLARTMMERLFTANDYTLGFNAKKPQKQFLDDLRYTTLLRGAFGFELVYDKMLQPFELRLVDMATIEWQEAKPGLYKPTQKIDGVNDPVSLDIPTFFTGMLHQNPNSVYGYSLFVSAINTIAARTQIINELYRIMKFTGYPRVDVTVVESVLMANAPPALRSDPKRRQEFVDAQLASIRGAFSTIQPDQAFVHTDAVTADMINDKNPGASLSVSEIIETLDAQNQAALKTMPSVVGKGTNGDVASAESRLFAMNCDSLNKTIADALSEAITFACRLAGFQGRIVIDFTPIELRPTLELEPHLTMKSSRLKQDLSEGLIKDDQYHLEMYGRPAAEGVPELSGTKFLTPVKVGVDEKKISPNDDPNGASLTSPGSKSANSNRTKSGQV